MKRKLLILSVALLAFGGTAYAAAVNGTYKGHNIIKVFANGVEVKTTVPGQEIDGSTMLPVRAIGDAFGAKVAWDAAKQRVDLTTNQAPTQPVQAGLTLEQLNKIGESVGVIFAVDGTGKAIKQGSGFIVRGNVLVTNHHVIEGASTIRVDFGNKSNILQVKDALFDNAKEDLFGIKLDGFPSLTLNTGTPVNKDVVYALGYPHNKFTITQGMFVGKWNEDGWNHSADVQPGNSGGIVINSGGEVIGITKSGNEAIKASILQAELDKL